MRLPGHPLPPKSLAVPAPGKQPAFEEVAHIVLTGALCGLSVCIMCLTQEMLERWMHQLHDCPHRFTLLDVLNTNRATLADWKALLRRQSYDVTVLHGVRSEVRARRVAVGYVKGLVDAVSSGLVVVV